MDVGAQLGRWAWRNGWKNIGTTVLISTMYYLGFMVNIDGFMSEVVNCFESSRQTSADCK